METFWIENVKMNGDLGNLGVGNRILLNVVRTHGDMTNTYGKSEEEGQLGDMVVITQG
jgi:hypothetical protein